MISITKLKCDIFMWYFFNKTIQLELVIRITLATLSQNLRVRNHVTILNRIECFHKKKHSRNHSPDNVLCSQTCRKGFTAKKTWLWRWRREIVLYFDCRTKFAWFWKDLSDSPRIFHNSTRICIADFRSINHHNFRCIPYFPVIQPHTHTTE